MDIRKFLNFEKNYYLFNREERNLAAIFYYLLLINNNLPKFLEHIKCDFKINSDEFGIYFEYSYLRDLWKEIENDNESKRKLILNFLKPKNYDYLSKLDIFAFNDYFGVANPSKNHIQYPGNWSLIKYDNNENLKNDNDEFLKICQFKWAFNIKPDIVIHLSNTTIIYIEAKLESNEGFYPTQTNEQDIFIRRFGSKCKSKYIKQCELQKYLLETLLGYKAKDYYLINKKNKKTSEKIIYWKDLFDRFDLTNSPNFIKKWIAENKCLRDGHIS